MIARASILAGCVIAVAALAGEARGDFAGVVAAHAVGNHTEPEPLLNREAVFVGRPDAAFVR